MVDFMRSLKNDISENDKNYCKEHSGWLITHFSITNIKLFEENVICNTINKYNNIGCLPNLTEVKINKYSYIVEMLKNECRRLKEKIRVKKSMRNITIYQIDQFFKLCHYEIEKFTSFWYFDASHYIRIKDCICYAAVWIWIS